jgi:hypothetical protein
MVLEEEEGGTGLFKLVEFGFRSILEDTLDGEDEDPVKERGVDNREGEERETEDDGAEVEDSRSTNFYHNRIVPSDGTDTISSLSSLRTLTVFPRFYYLKKSN